LARARQTKLAHYGVKILRAIMHKVVHFHSCVNELVL
jgi:hypothetical protein